MDSGDEDWQRLGRSVRFMHLDLPVTPHPYHFRFPATITLAEAARQIGRRLPPAPGRPKRHEPFYERALRVLADEEGETVYLEELTAY